MLKFLQILLISLILPTPSLATAQIGDILIWQGDTLLLFTNPLETYFELKGERTLNDKKLDWATTACYRGYQATWQIMEDSLFLINIDKGYNNDNPLYFDLQKEFGSKKVFANWFTGDLLAPKGKQIHPAYGGYKSFYETELAFSFDKGILSSKEVYDNSKSYKSIFSKDQDKLIDFIYSNINWAIVPDLKEEKKQVVYIHILSGASKKPHQDSIRLVRGTDSELLNKEALRVLQMLPEWNVYYRLGKPYRMIWTMPVVFSEKYRRKYARKASKK